MAFLLLFIATLAASPALHAAIHPDANHEDHNCIISVFAHGQVNAAAVAVAPVVVPVVCVELSLPVFSVFSATIENLPQGRAPPVFASSQV